MDTQNGTQAQSGFTGQQTTNNNVQGQPAFTAQQATNINGMNPATPTRNNFYPAMPIVRGTMNTQQAPPQGQPGFAAQQLVHGTGHGHATNYTVPFRNRQGAPTHSAHGNARLVHNGPRAQPGFVRQQSVNFSGSDLAMALANDPNAMAGFSQICNQFLQQQAQYSNVQNYENIQNRHSIQPYPNNLPQQSDQVQQYQPNSQDHQNFHGRGDFNTATIPTGGEVSSGDNTPVVDLSHDSTPNIIHSANPTTSLAGHPSQLVAGNPPNAVAAEPIQPPMAQESPEDFQTRVNLLVSAKGHTFGNHIRSDADQARFEKAIWTAKWKGGKLEDKAGDYPDDEAERSEIVRRIFDAIVNTEGDQDPATDAADNGNCLAVRVIQKMSSIEIEVLARKLMVSTEETRRIFE